METKIGYGLLQKFRSLAHKLGFLPSMMHRRLGDGSAAIFVHPLGQMADKDALREALCMQPEGFTIDCSSKAGLERVGRGHDRFQVLRNLDNGLILWDKMRLHEVSIAELRKLIRGERVDLPGRRANAVLLDALTHQGYHSPMPLPWKDVSGGIYFPGTVYKPKEVHQDSRFRPTLPMVLGMIYGRNGWAQVRFYEDMEVRDSDKVHVVIHLD